MAQRKIEDETTKQKILDLYPNLSLKTVAQRVGFSMNAVREFLVEEGVTLRTRGRPRRVKQSVQSVQTEKRDAFSWDA